MTSDSIIYYGGSFNPPHIAHVLFVTALRAYFPESEIWVSPTYSHAFRKELMPFDFRVEMLRVALEPVSGVTVSTIERELETPTSYTIDVVREILRRRPGARVRVAVGADIVPTLPQWRAYDELCRIAEFLIFPREGYDCFAAIEMPHLPEISSSQIREAAARGDWGYIKKYVPARVADMLMSSNQK